MRGGDEARIDAHVDAAVDQLGHAEQLGHEAELPAVGDVDVGDGGDAFVLDVGQRDPAVEGDRREDRHLGGRVLARHVLGRVGLGEAQILGFGERRAVLRAGLGHGRQNVVGRAVDDAHDAGDLGRRQRLAQHLDDRHGPHRARLEAQERAVVFGGLQKLGTVLREELLVGGDHRLASLERGELERARRLDAADQLDHHADRGIVQKVAEVGRRAHPGRHQGATFGRELADRAQRHVLAGRQADLVGAFVQQAPDAGTHGPVAHKSDTHLFHSVSLLSRQSRATAASVSGRCSRSTSSHVSRAMITRALPPATMTTAGRGWPL